MVIVAAEGLGWSSREAARQRAAVGWRGWAGAAGKLRGRGRQRVLQRGCRGEGVLWLTLMLGRDLDVATWV